EQAREREVALVVAAQQGQPRRRLVAVGQPDIGAQDRLDTGTLGLAVELDRSARVVEGGQRDGRLLELHAALDQLAGPDGGAGKGEFAVEVKVYEGRGGHAAVAYRLGRRPD